MTTLAPVTGDLRLLRHHGDLDAAPGLLDFAVNVRGGQPPHWLRERLVDALGDLGRYPAGELDLAAREAVAKRHGRDPEEVMILNGVAEGFALLPQLLPDKAAVLHPSFTEPELALRKAGVPVHRVLSTTLRPGLVPEDADMVVLGNPTNPTSVLHKADVIAELARPGRILVVDEAFMDAVPGEPETLTGQRIPGLLVFRSLTKTWALAGLRAGYALAEPVILDELGLHRPQWPVGSLPLTAVTACCEPDAVARAQADADLYATYRADLAKHLGDLGLDVHEPAAAPFLLVKTEDGGRIRAALRERGIAVRRGDTFPGLTADHLRITVRPPEDTDRLLAALREVL
jgi:histidinol-phosphate aminotransferase